jgi:FtsZ-interacting cell division protein ZipA
MDEYQEKQKLFRDVPVKRARPVGGSPYEAVIHEHRGMSAGAVVALVLAAVAAAVAITLLIMNGQQKSRDDELAQAKAAQQSMPQPQQQPQLVPSQPVPQQNPAALPQPQVPAQLPAPAPQAQPASPSNAELEVEAGGRLADDSQLRAYPIDVKVESGKAVLSGHVPNDELKSRAEILLMSIKGIRRIVNNIEVQPD